MGVLMLLLLILAVALITVAVHANRKRIRTHWANTTRSNAVLTHQSYADTGGAVNLRDIKAYDIGRKVEAKARDWICVARSKAHRVLHRHVLSYQHSPACGHMYGYAT